MSTEPHAVLLRPRIFSNAYRVVAAFTTRLGGVSSGPFGELNVGMSTGDDAEAVASNRSLALGAVGFSVDQLALAGQVHGAKVAVVDKPVHLQGCDGLVTRTSGIVLGILAADCAAVLLADDDAGVIGACHAGWRGAVGGVVEETIDAMRREGAKGHGIRSWISPCISAAHFEVGPEVAAQFPDEFVRPLGSGKAMVDLKGEITRRLIQSGVAPGNIETDAGCTVADEDRFFSHRRDHGRSGRMMGIIGMRNA